MSATSINHTELLCEVRGGVGLMTLNRAKALNALSLGMVRALTAVLQAWQYDPAVQAVAIRGMGKDRHQPGASVPFGAFCAGGDIRFFHQAALAGDPQLEDFFTEEYALNHLIHAYPKPYIAFLDGIVMGGGMGIAGHARPVLSPGQTAASLRLVTPNTRMAMPETNIGLFPDVGGGYFLSRCPGHIGEYLALTGDVIGGADAVAAGLADALVPAEALPGLWDALAVQGIAGFLAEVATKSIAGNAELARAGSPFDACFGMETVSGIQQALQREGSEAALKAQATLRQRSPLMLHVVLEQVRRARRMSLADDLRMERDMVRHCFHTRHLGRSGVTSETVEGIRALAVDKDHSPRWNPAGVEEVTPDMVEPFFESPWPADAHPLAALR